MDNKNQKTTSGTWRYSDNTMQSYSPVASIKCKEATIAHCFRINADDKEGIANAEHIVKCVNLHEEMLAGVRECYNYFSAPNFTDRHGTAERLKTILDKANQ